MTWLIYALAGVAGLVLLIVIVGALLPKSHVATRGVVLKQSPEAIWAVISDFENQPAWRSDLKSIERLPAQNGHPVWREHYTNGMSVPYEIVEFAPPAKMVGQVADPSLAFGGNWTYELSPVEGGTSVRITENGEIYSPIFRFMAKFIFGYHGTLVRYLKSLGRKLRQEVDPQ